MQTCKKILVVFLITLLSFSGCSFFPQGTGESIDSNSEDDVGEQPKYTFNVEINTLEPNSIPNTLEQSVASVSSSVIEFFAEKNTESTTENRYSGAVVIGKKTVSGNLIKHLITNVDESVSDSTDDDSLQETLPDKEISIIITCHDNIKNFNKFSVRTQNMETYEAYLIGSDPLSGISVLAVEADLTPCAIAVGENVIRTGSSVFSLTNPIESLRRTLKTGIISAANRKLSIYGVEKSFIQTDAGFGASDSGGGLFDVGTGALVGLMCPQRVDIELNGISFAIDSNLIKTVSEEFLTTVSETSRGYIDGRVILGAIFKDSKVFGSPQYVYISEIDVFGSFFKDGGLKVNDKIFAVEYQPVDGEKKEIEVVSAAALESFFADLSLSVGDKFRISYGRNNFAPPDVNFSVTQYIYGEK